MNSKTLLAIALLFAFSCRQEVVLLNSNPAATSNNNTSKGTVAPASFKWQFLQDYLITLSSDTLLDDVSFTLYGNDGNLVYTGKINFGYTSFMIRIPRDVQFLTVVSNNPKIVPGQSIDLSKNTAVYNGKSVIKTNITADKLWIKKPNGAIFNTKNRLFKGGDILNLWDENEYVYTRTLFEDLWPSTADYDFNDMVVDNLNTFEIRNAQNQSGSQKRPIGLGNKVVSQLKGTYVVQANGAGFNNGLAVQLFGEHYNQDGSITPINDIANYISNFKFTNSSGKANAGAKVEYLPNGEVVIIIFARINDVKGSIFQNTDAYTRFGLGDTINFTIDLNTKVDQDYWNGKLSNFRYSHPFLLQNGDRSIEIHVAGEMPTMMANASLFGTGEDNTNMAVGRTFVSKKQNFPWALTVPSNFIWATEKVDLLKAYPAFSEWIVKNRQNLNEWRYIKVDSLVKNIN
ncbi:MAG: LruC domain-containing protein [Candidatus Methylacidiphilales bacterium]